MKNMDNKFDMFADIANDDFDFTKLEEGESSEVVSVTLKSESKRKFSNVKSRTQEEYETYIQSQHYETLIHPLGHEYQVLVTVLKPEVNPLENLKPVFCWSSNH